MDERLIKFLDKWDALRKEGMILLSEYISEQQRLDLKISELKRIQKEMELTE